MQQAHVYPQGNRPHAIMGDQEEKYQADLNDADMSDHCVQHLIKLQQASLNPNGGALLNHELQVLGGTIHPHLPGNLGQGGAQRPQNVWSMHIGDGSFRVLAAMCADNSATKQEQAQILLNSPTNTLSQADHDCISWLNHHHQLTPGFVPTPPWLTGMFDGDVRVVTITQPRVKLQLELYQPSCLPLLPVIQQQFGGNITHGGAKLKWSVQQNVRAVLEAIMHFLVKK